MLQAKFLLKLIEKLIEIFQVCGILITRRKFKLLGLQRNLPLPPPSPLPQLPSLVEHSDLPMRKILKVVVLLTVLIFPQSKKFAACKVKNEKMETIWKDEKEETIFKQQFSNNLLNKSWLLKLKCASQARFW